MKKILSLVTVAVLLCGMAIVAGASNPADEKVVLDTSVFEQKDRKGFELYDCMCSDLLGIYHMGKGGITFFDWVSEDNKMLSHIKGTCFSVAYDEPWRETVVFLDGVPNLVNNLFKAWEDGTDDVYIPDSVTEIDEDCFVKNSHITLHFTKNNATALAYAQNRGMAFEVMDGERTANDVNFDQITDMKDVLALRKSIAHMPAAYEIYSLDINADGDADMKDVLSLRKTIAGMDK